MRYRGEYSKRCEYNYRHPSTCLALCHTSQQLADGFILSPALSPRLFSVTFLRPSASICLPSAPSSSVSYAHLESSHTAVSLSPVSCVLAASYTNLTIKIWNKIAKIKKKKKQISLIDAANPSTTAFNLSAQFCWYSDCKNGTGFERLKSLGHTRKSSPLTTGLAFLSRHQSSLSC